MHHPVPQTAGIDIAKDRLDVCLYPDGAARRFANDAKGHRALITWLSSHAIQRVVFEPTGAYYHMLERHLARAGLCSAPLWTR
jgi:transposase